MQSYFNVNLEFDKVRVDHIIQNAIESGRKGYVCSVEGNVLANANSSNQHLQIVNNALVNICDGNSIAILASIIHRRKFKTYIGADFFIKYIKLARYKSFFLGNTNEVLLGLKSNLIQFDDSIRNMQFEPLPFLKIDDFNYHEIADMINRNNPDIIWVSLGAPKQEIFMSKLLPLLNRGILFGAGAILNFFSSNSNEKRAPKIFLKLKIEWLHRLLINPKKQWPKIKLYLKVLPGIIKSELNKTKEF